MNRHLFSATLLMLTAFGCAQVPQRAAPPALQPQPQVKQPEPAAVPQQPSEEELKARTRQLIGQLGSTKYREREDAQAELEKLINTASPIAAVPMLKAHKSTKDPEVKMRLNKILQPYLRWGITPCVIKAVPNILRALNGEKVDEVRSVIRKLRALSHEDSKEILFAILRRWHCVKLRATDALVEEADSATVETFVRMLGPRSEEEDNSSSRFSEPAASDYCRYALRRLGGKAVKPLVEILCNQDTVKNCMPFARMLTKLGEKGQCALLQVLKKNSLPAKEAALECILENTIMTPPLDILEKLLKEEKPEIRGYSATFLGLVEKEKASDLLAGLLEDEDKDVRYKAAFALGERGDRRAFPILKKALKEEASDFRHKAVLALGGINDGCVVEPLVSAFGDSSYDIKEAAEESLCRLSAAVTPEIMKAYENQDCHFRVRVFEVIIGRGWYRKDLAKILVRAVKDPNQYIRKNALSCMSAMASEEFLEFFIIALSDPYSEMRCAATSALRKLKDRRAVEPLIAAMKEGKGYEKTYAAYALGETGGKQAYKAIVKAYDRGDIGLSLWTAKALHEIGDRDVVELLIRALQSEESGRRGAAVKCLKEFGDERALEPLLKLLLSEHSNAYIPEAMRKIAGKKAIPYLIWGLQSKYSYWSKEQLLMFGEDAIEPLRKVLLSGDKKMQELALDVLIMLREEEAHKLLLDKLNKNPDKVSASLVRRLLAYGDKSGVEALLANKDTYQNAVFMLAKLGDKRAIEPLKKMLNGEIEVSSREDVAAALAKLGDETVVELLISMLLEDSASDHAHERAGAAEALEAFKGSRVVDALIKSLSDESEDVRQVAVNSLVTIGDKRAIEPLMNMPVSDFMVIALREFRAPETTDYFLKIVKNRAFMTDTRHRLTYLDRQTESRCNDECKITAVYALGEIGDKRAVEHLRRVVRFKPSYLSMAAAWGLIRFGDEAGAKALKEGNRYYLSWTVMDSPSKKALPWLIEALDDKDNNSFAARALGKLGGRQAAEALVAALEKHPDNYVIDALAQVEEAKTLKKPVYGRMIAALTTVLERNDSRNIRQAAQKALEEITGQNFGWNYQRWRRWFEENKDK